ncbi:MAG: hypothetical protein EA398_05005 [Deltaproteobacteria bacterium]|nr:MAG: hypothetical protein EA398_05005 [Deltaproteobacteria bacterium]
MDTNARLIPVRRMLIACLMILVPVAAGAAHATPDTCAWPESFPMLASAPGAPLPAIQASRRPAPPPFSEVIRRVTAMPGDADLRRRANLRGLNVLNVLWEDTGRSAGSALGPNISDVTLQVFDGGSGNRRQSHLLPVLRFPNFTDRTADIPLDHFQVRVGNHRGGGSLRTASLREVLEDIRPFLSNPRHMDGDGRLLADRDTHVLVSAQHVFLPIPARGEASFSPVIFNYQSAPGNPAVLVLLVTRQGLSATVVENRRGEQTRQGHGQQLFFNAGGERALFTAERLSTVQQRVDSGQGSADDVDGLQEGSDVLLLVQIPLVHENRGRLHGLGSGAGSMAPDGAVLEMAAPRSAAGSDRARSDVERAVLGHGETEGPFIEMNGQRLRRDARFPIRVTVQFYRATSNGVVSDEDLEQVRAEIERVYAQGDWVGSLVVPDGPRERPTDWIHTNPGGDTWQHPPCTGPWWNCRQ